MKDEALRLALEALQYNDHLRGEAITAIKQALEQPEPEPVAWMNKHGACMSAVFKQVDATAGEYTTPLYTSPPKREWQGLTDVDVSKILDEQNGFYTFEKCFNFAKAIEAKLKERNT